MSVVQHKMDQEAEEKEAAEREPQQWKEVVEDIWREHLPHFRGAVYTGEGDFLFDAATGQYGFQYEGESEGEDDLMGGGDEEEAKEDEEFVVVPEEEQPHSVLPSLAKDDECEPFHSYAVVKECQYYHHSDGIFTVSRLMQQPGMKQKLASYAKTLKEGMHSVPKLSSLENLL